jgi:hypothetical protein
LSGDYSDERIGFVLGIVGDDRYGSPLPRWMQGRSDPIALIAADTWCLIQYGVSLLESTARRCAAALDVASAGAESSAAIPEAESADALVGSVSDVA